MKSVLISIQPYYVFLIIARLMGWDIPQEKKIEVRKDFPKDSEWNDVAHIYCSKNRKSFNLIPKQYQPFMEKLLGKVIGEFVCDKIGRIRYQKKYLDEELTSWSAMRIFAEEIKATCLTLEELNTYGKGKNLYGWRIADLKIYDRPKALWEFRKPLEHVKCGYFNRIGCSTECCYFGTEQCCNTYPHWRKGICPPQSWCYVEE